VINVALYPSTVPSDRAADVTVRVTNRSEHPLHGLFVQLDAGTAAMVVTGALQIEQKLLAPGKSVERIVGLCGREPGTAMVTVPNVSYRVRGESVRQPVAPLELTVLAVVAEPPPQPEAPAVVTRQLVFVSYRHSGGRSFPQLLVDRLCRHLDADVFFDYDAIHPGDRWRRRIDDALGRASALLAVIGPDWVGSRILQEGDVLRYEIATALRRGILVLPVLYGDARRPRADQLPSDVVDMLEIDISRVDDRVMDDDLRRIVVTMRQQAGIRRRTRGSGASL
jgi:hypothetical protein